MSIEQLNRQELEEQIRYANEALEQLRQRFGGRQLPIHLEEFRRAIEAQLAYAGQLGARL